MPAQDSGPSVGATSPLVPSEDGEALQVVVPLAEDEVVDDVEALTARSGQDRPEGLQAWVKGPAGSTADPVAGFERILVLGAATDYSLLCTARYRDALLHHRRHAEATRPALRGTTEPVLAPVLLLLTTVVSCFAPSGSPRRRSSRSWSWCNRRSSWRSGCCWTRWSCAPCWCRH